MLETPYRTIKPRTYGITAVNDTRLSIGELKSILDDYSDFLDIAKLGVGVAHVIPNLQEKIALYQQYGITVYFGGTLFEKYYYQDKLEEYLSFLKDHNISTIEISCGTVDIPIEERCKLVERLTGSFQVISEVGSKDKERVMPPSEWIKEINMLFNSGAEYVITEGRDSGTAGIYRPSGELRTGLIADIVAQTNVEKLIFEAPATKLQMYFINEIGANVNLGNINPTDLAILEAQRQGLRSETFFISQ